MASPPEIWKETLEAPMNMYIASRLFVPVLAFILVVSGVLAGPASASAQLEERSWSESESQENVLVQACDGFDLTSSYTVNRDHHRFIDVSDDLNVEWMGVDFSGAIANAKTDKSYAYDGKFTRWADYQNDTVAITNLNLRFEVGTSGEFTVAADRIEMNLVADPAEVVEKFVPNALQMELCYLLDDASAGQAPQSDTAPDYSESSALNPPANYQSGDDAGSCEPRRGYPQDCLH
jgi:hypothetical protein